ncbi:HTH-type transcriptional repressor of iron proteins A [Achromobacter xylosoxidans]|nr:HTH-type transcriptional repressor of iron proteins A [Achromobacter xylosoxidans]
MMLGVTPTAHPGAAIAQSPVRTACDARPATVSGELLFCLDRVLVLESRSHYWPLTPTQALWSARAQPCEQQFEGQAGFARLPMTWHGPGDAIDGDMAVSLSGLARHLLQVISTQRVRADRQAALLQALIFELRDARAPLVGLPKLTDTTLVAIEREMTCPEPVYCTIESWEERLGVHRRTLHRNLLRGVGLSYRQWSHQAQAIAALRLIEAGKAPAQIAAVLGFASASSFHVFFRRLVGSTPGSIAQLLRSART